MLQNFAAHVERQIFAVDDAAHETEVCRKQFAVVVGDKHALDVELYAAFVIGLIHIEGRGFRNVKERRIFLRTFGVRVDVHERILSVAAHRFVEFVVVRFFQIALRSFPYRARAVYLIDFIFARRDIALVVVFVSRIVKIDRKRDIIAVFFNKFFDLPTARVLFAVVV